MNWCNYIIAASSWLRRTNVPFWVNALLLTSVTLEFAGGVDRFFMTPSSLLIIRRVTSFGWQFSFDFHDFCLLANELNAVPTIWNNFHCVIRSIDKCKISVQLISLIFSFLEIPKKKMKMKSRNLLIPLRSLFCFCSAFTFPWKDWNRVRCIFRVVVYSVSSNFEGENTSKRAQNELKQLLVDEIIFWLQNSQRKSSFWNYPVILDLFLRNH